jgi:hypothetical protein
MIQLSIEEIKRLYQEGRSVDAIAHIYRISSRQVKRHLRAEGIELRNGTDPRTMQERIRIFWTRVDKNGPTPRPDPAWTVEQKLPPQWQWDGSIWIWTEGPCWIWKGGKIKGYGNFRSEGKSILAHHFSYELEYGPIEEEIFGEPVEVLHTCDNRPCVRPSHLSKGMQSENFADMVSKNRQAKGVSLPQSKLDWDKVLRIRAIYATGELTQGQIGKQFGVGRPTVSDVVRKKSWWPEPQ